ncbi:integumentary mucin C.1-like [Drosophila rhopaloa]|uniref:Integumentary mucin C.1-like n=1 Tax=Drosophila rhopaloa TaxID=1041015 RepID=A0ABM5JCP5_DRORH|nr:integumentary mucin C.1-like [Drosophila rhopaloa]
MGRQAPHRNPHGTTPTPTTRNTLATPTTTNTTTATTRNTLATPTTTNTTTATTRNTLATPTTTNRTITSTRQTLATSTTKETTRQATDNEERPPMPRTTTGTKRHQLADHQRPQTKWVTPRRLSALDFPGVKPINLSEESEEEWEPKPRGREEHLKRVEEAVVRLKATWRSGNRKTTLVVSDNHTTRIRIGRDGHVHTNTNETPVS